ncbi:MAG: AraC family transcriptional regulator [Clostridia bacterium]|nr:AraC family transcriptional regulator [Clostridia bacterium]
MGHEPDGAAAVMSGIEKINVVIDYIEAHLTEELAGTTLAHMAGLSVYEFRRIFSFIVGLPVGEYVRRRRLTLAGEDIKSGRGSLQEIGLRYGYEIASSFGRAFREYHGVSPKDARCSDISLKSYARPAFDLVVRGGEELSYTIRSLPRMAIVGVRALSPLTDTVCCESVWHRFEKTVPEREGEPLYAAYLNGEEQVDCCVGYLSDTAQEAENSMIVPPAQWVCFDLPEDAGEQEINALYSRILYTFLPSSSYCLQEAMPNLEIFPPNGGMTVMIPIKEKNA